MQLFKKGEHAATFPPLVLPDMGRLAPESSAHGLPGIATAHAMFSTQTPESIVRQVDIMALQQDPNSLLEKARAEAAQIVAEAQAQFRVRGRKMAFNNGQGYPVAYYPDSSLLLNGANPQLEGKITGATDSNGVVIADASPQEIKSKVAGKRVRFTAVKLTDQDLTGLPVTTATISDHNVQLLTNQPEAVLRELFRREIEISDLEVSGADLEDAFIALTTHPGQD